MESVKRRLSCPQTIQLIWDAINAIKHAKQQCSMERILAILKKKNGLDDEFSTRQLHLAVLDKLMFTSQKIGSKGCQVGVEQTIYHLPDKGIEKDGHDWYCFKCQKGGSVLSCKHCFRVYHAVCCNREDLIKASSVEKFICPICTVVKAPNPLKLKKEDLNTLLGYTCNRLKEKPFKELNREPPNREDQWREKCLIYNYVDLATLEEKSLEKKYRRLEEFEADVQNIVHNVVIFYGVNSPVADMARQMLRDCSYDLREIQQCQDCYRMSNEKKDRYWFCQPCNPPHELVYAKQKGYPFWPAKVIRRMNSDSIFDVRFFGGPHERATVERVNIRPITTNPLTLGVKRSTSWTRACDEMKKHQEIVCKQFKTTPVNLSFESDDFLDEEADSEDEQRPKKIDRYVRIVSARSSPKVEATDQCDDWSPIRRSGRSRNKAVHHNSNSDSAKRSPNLGEDSSPKASKSQSFESSASDEEERPRRKSEPLKMSGHHLTELHLTDARSEEDKDKSMTSATTSKTPQSAALLAVRKRGRPPLSVPRSLRLPAKEECSGEGGEDSNSSRRINPRRSVNCKSDSSPGDSKDGSRPSSRNSNSKSMKTEQKSSRPLAEDVKRESASQTLNFRAHINGQSLNASTNCKVQVKRLLEGAGPSYECMAGEPKVKRRGPWSRNMPGISEVSLRTVGGEFAFPERTMSSLVRQVGQCRTPTPDDLNVVSSSSQLDTVVSQVCVATQTPNLGQFSKVNSKCVQTDCMPSSNNWTVSNAVTSGTRVLERTFQADLKHENASEMTALQHELQDKLTENEARLTSRAAEELRKAVDRTRAETEAKFKECHGQEIRDIMEKHQQLVSEIKKKQWCYNCENEAIYHCCWNTSYCSTECQQLHWQKEHKRTCRRKR